MIPRILSSANNLSANGSFWTFYGGGRIRLLNSNKLANKVSELVKIINQNDLKALKKIMKTKLSKNLKFIQNGLVLALEYENNDALKILLSSPLLDLSGEIDSFLHFAVTGSKIEILQTLLADKRFDVNRMADGMTPLMEACGSEKIEMVRKLLEHPDIDVNAVDKDPEKESNALEYALSNGNIDIIQLLLDHKDASHREIQDFLLLGFLAISDEDQDYSFNFDILNILLKKNFVNGYKLKHLFLENNEFHDYFQNWSNEEFEMKIRGEYYSGNIDVSMESLENQVFGVSIDVLQASILKCKCVDCLEIKELKKTVYNTYGESQIFVSNKPNLFMTPIDSSDGEDSSELKIVKIGVLENPKEQANNKNGTKNYNMTKKSKKSKVKCLLDAKVLTTNRSFEVRSEEFVSMTLPDIFKDTLLHGGHDNDMDSIINGTKSLVEITEAATSEFCQSILNEIIDKVSFLSQEKLSTPITEKDKSSEQSSPSIGKKSTLFSSLCWTCSDTQVKLYKCGGCRKARYCSDKCIADDWQVHMSYCMIIQEKRKKNITNVVHTNKSAATLFQ